MAANIGYEIKTSTCRPIDSLIAGVYCRVMPGYLRKVLWAATITSLLALTACTESDSKVQPSVSAAVSTGSNQVFIDPVRDLQGIDGPLKVEVQGLAPTIHEKYRGPQQIAVPRVPDGTTQARVYITCDAEVHFKVTFGKYFEGTCIGQIEASAKIPFGESRVINVEVPGGTEWWMAVYFLKE